MTNTIAIQAAWIGDGKSAATAFRPSVVDDHQGAAFPFGIYGDPLAGPATHLAACDDRTLADIQANPKYSGKIVIPPAQSVVDLQAKIASQKADASKTGDMAKAMIALGLTVSPELQAAADAANAQIINRTN